MMPSIGSERSVSMQTPTTTMRASRGAPSNTCWINPGTPTHSKISAGFSAGNNACSGGRAAFSSGDICGMLGPGRIGMRARGVDDDVGAELFGQRPPRRRIIGGDDRVHPLDLQRGDDGEPHRAAADHQRHLAAPDVGFGHGMHADRQRLGQRGVLGAPARWGLPAASASLSSMRSA